jgi:hypothetical protein
MAFTSAAPPRLVLLLLLLRALTAPTKADAQEPCIAGSTWSATGLAPCAACRTCAGSAGTLVQASCAAAADAVCGPSAALTAGPSDTAYFLSGSAAEGVPAAFAVAGAAPTFAADHLGNADGALVLASGSYLTAAGAGAVPAALPSGGSVAWSASAWVKCAAPETYAAVLEWGAAGDAFGGATANAIALDVTSATSPAAATVTSTFSLSGGGSAGSSAVFIAVWPDSGNVVYAVPYNLHSIRMVSPTGAISILAGSAEQYYNSNPGYLDAVGTNARFSSPWGVAVNTLTGDVVVGDTGNNRIRLIAPDMTVTTLAGGGTGSASDGTGSGARFSGPRGVAVDKATGNIVVADTGASAIRIVTPVGVVSTLAGASAGLSSPEAVAVMSITGVVGYGQRSRKARVACGCRDHACEWLQLPASSCGPAYWRCCCR